MNLLQDYIKWVRENKKPIQKPEPIVKEIKVQVKQKKQ